MCLCVAADRVPSPPSNESFDADVGGSRTESNVVGCDALAVPVGAWEAGMC